MPKAKPGKYTKQAISDLLGTALVVKLITQTNRAIIRLDAQDKWPNIDGYITLIDHDGFPISDGNIVVQVKAVRSKKIGKTIQLTEKFISYCTNKVTDSLILLFVVDIVNEVIYWQIMEKNQLARLTDRKLPIDKSRCINNRSDGSFVDDWSKEYDARLIHLSPENVLMASDLDELYDTLDDNFTEIHRYLDALNNLLDIHIPIVKRRFFSGVWKLGFAYEAYSDDNITYAHFSILGKENTTQIKKLKPRPLREQSQNTLDIRFNSSNVVRDNPKKAAAEFVDSYLDKLLSHYLLDESGCVVLAEETLLLFINKYAGQLGLSQDREYTINSIANAVETYLPTWVHYARQEIGLSGSYEANFFNLSEETKSKITQLTEAHIKGGTPTPRVGIIDNLFGRALRALDTLKLTQITTIKDESKNKVVLLKKLEALISEYPIIVDNNFYGIFSIAYQRVTGIHIFAGTKKTDNSEVLVMCIAKQDDFVTDDSNRVTIVSEADLDKIDGSMFNPTDKGAFIYKDIPYHAISVIHDGNFNYKSLLSDILYDYAKKDATKWFEKYSGEV